MKSRSGYMTMAMMALAMAEDGLGKPNLHERAKYNPNPEEDQATKDRYKQLMIKRGLKEFYINGETVWARDEKNAIRKANNLKQTTK